MLMRLGTLNPKAMMTRIVDSKEELLWVALVCGLWSLILEERFLCQSIIVLFSTRQRGEAGRGP